MIKEIVLNEMAPLIAAHLYLPEAGRRPYPAVVMAPGFGGVKEMLIPHYANALAAAGIATIAVDYPNFGASYGTPRQHVDIKAHLATYRRALDYLQKDARIDSQKLGVWGSSLSGGHALVTAAHDKRVKSVYTIIPFIATSLKMAPVFARVTMLDLLGRTLGRQPKTIKVAGRPEEFAVMNTDGAWDWMQIMTADSPRFVNEVTVSSLLQMANYRTGSAARKIRVPLKVVLASDDTITPAAMVKKAVAKTPNVQIEEYPETHFELFDRYLQATIDSTVKWFRSTLDVA